MHMRRIVGLAAVFLSLPRLPMMMNQIFVFKNFFIQIFLFKRTDELNA